MSDLDSVAGRLTIAAGLLHDVTTHIREAGRLSPANALLFTVLADDAANIARAVKFAASQIAPYELGQERAQEGGGR